MFNPLNSVDNNLTAYDEDDYNPQSSGSFHSINLLDYCRKFNIIITILIVISGLIGHFLTILVYIQKRFRLNSSNVYLLCLAFIDGTFLIIHILEDTIRTIKDSYSKEINQQSFIHILNIIDLNELACRTINYLRNSFRLISAYIIVAFTIQRLFIVYQPLSNNFKSKKSAWRTVSIITSIALLMNAWVPFIFTLNTEDTHSFCDVDRNWTNIYFLVNAAYMGLLIMLPIITIFICNSLIILKTGKDDLRRSKYKQKIRNKPSHQSSMSTSIKMKSRSSSCQSSRKTVLLRKQGSIKTLAENVLRRQSTRFNASYSKKMTKTLLLVSFTYAFFNIPYLISWCMFFDTMTRKIVDPTYKNYLFAALQITELFNILNYGIHFFVYCLAGTLFRSQLEYTFRRQLTSNQILN